MFAGAAGRNAFLFFALAVALNSIAFGKATPIAGLDYQRDIQPVLSENCFSCHGPDPNKRKAGLRLDRQPEALKELKEGGFAIVPGDCSKSKMLEVIASEDSDVRMPPAKTGKRLTRTQIDLLTRWIQEGAKWKPHWSFIKPERPALPPMKNRRWPLNPIDRFILARLEKEGLRPSPEADKTTLIRRLTLDLTGLPPTIEEIDAFLADKRKDAYERLVDRLMASPHYGEQRARMWLDLARYADTDGFEKDPRRSVWPWRDWVINAFNKNVPFDEFTMEQIAGDMLPNATREQKVASGFNRNTLLNTEGGIDQEEDRVQRTVDRVNTTANVWLGLTMNCCQCHTHKYDPITQKEYYQFYAFFNSVDEPTLDLPSPEQQARREKLQAEIAKLEAEIKTIPTNAQSALINKLAEVRKDEEKLRSEIPTTLTMQERGQPRETQIHIGGNFLTKGEKVFAGVPQFLPPLPEGRTNRLALARWLASTNNPLTARVTVNRFWEQLFGRGLVLTVEDFGMQGERPSHPELLDWLACEFMSNGWDMKAMHKLMAMSATYRQSSQSAPGLLERDSDNRLLARGPRFRVPAETVRDINLAASGLLKQRVGGASVFPFQPEGIWTMIASSDKWTMSEGDDRYRRGLYTFWRRTAPYPSYFAFDVPTREVFCTRRPRTNTPLQALTTLNDPAFFEAAQELAVRVIRLCETDLKKRITFAFRLCTARAPQSKEMEKLLSLYQRELVRFQQDRKAAETMTHRYYGADAPKELDAAEVAAWTVVANVLLNLDETITKS
jgi:hypothetical protein